MLVTYILVNVVKHEMGVALESKAQDWLWVDRSLKGVISRVVCAA
jgi:hypothetical protein